MKQLKAKVEATNMFSWLFELEKVQVTKDHS